MSVILLIFILLSVILLNIIQVRVIPSAIRLIVVLLKTVMQHKNCLLWSYSIVRRFHIYSFCWVRFCAITAHSRMPFYQMPLSFLCLKRTLKAILINGFLSNVILPNVILLNVVMLNVILMAWKNELMKRQSWQYNMIKLNVVKTTSWWNDKLTKWQVG